MKERELPELRETQRWLASVILEPEKLDDRAFGDEIARVLVAASRAAVAARLRAYTGGYPARIGEALAESYPAVQHVVGATRFDELTARYLPHVPMGIYNLNEVGASLPPFLAGSTLARDFPFAPDLARLEWAVHEAFHAHEVEPFDPASLAGWTLEDWSAAVLEFQPSVAAVSSPWPIRDIWDARETPIEEIDIVLEGRAQSALVYRSGYKVVCESVDAHEAQTLEAVRRGMSLGDAVQEIAASGGDPEDVTRWFGRWSGCGLVAHVHSGD